jgi:signal transduction histidine kinase
MLPAMSGAEKPGDRLKERSLPELEQRLTDIDSGLEQLASCTLRSGTGNLGYRSRRYRQPDSQEWIHLELGEVFPIDQIVLVPTLWRDTESGVRSEGFPSAFSLFAGTDDATNLVASFSAEDHLLPRIAPLAVPFAPVEASWVRIEATTLSPDIGEINHSLQLSEILVFSDQVNVALQKPVTVPITRKDGGPQHERFLTDGFGPYLMDSAQGLRSHTELLQVNSLEPPPSLTIDLNAPHAVSQINLHTASAALSIPMINFSSWGVPRHVRVTGANHPDFSDETVLFEHEQQTIYDAGPIIMRRFTETFCRYIRITILDHSPVTPLGENPTRIGFSEIEVLSKSRNVALGAPVSISSGLSCGSETLAKITDGRNYYGNILSTQDWMNQLARRHDLETERPLVVAELNQRYERQKANLHLLAWAVALLTAGSIITILIGKVLRQRAVFRTRERIAANLHDELGANLHAIGLFGDLAKQEVSKADDAENRSRLIRYVEEVRALTEQAGKTARYCTDMLEAKELYENLVEEMERTADRLLTDLEHDCAFPDPEQLQKLHPRRRIGLFLFYKECLTNILRHSRATRVETRLAADKKEICLTVCDNGLGIAEPPRSLKRRARLLKAKLSVERPPEGGTKITLRLRK